jgi:tetratricopeptide (TPR) repeat protein
MKSKLLAGLLVSLTMAAGCFGQESKSQLNPDLFAADRLQQSGNIAAAIAKYQDALKRDPGLVPAQAGLVRAYLRDDQVDAAYDLAKSSLAAQPNSATLLSAMGWVQYRRGEITEAEVSFLKAKKVDPNHVDAYLGLNRVYRTALLYRKAYDQIQKAHSISPGEPAVQRAWLGMLPRSERIKALEAYLAAPHPENEEENADLRAWLDYLRSTANQPVHSCKLANAVEQTETTLHPMLRDPKHMNGYGLIVKLNDHSQRLLLDTGAGGIIINRRTAEKAGLKQISKFEYGGIGDKGRREAYYAVVDDIRIGDLDFKDCVVSVSEKSMGLDEDGLIGADVFGAYVVDIDFPAEKLRLTPLPKRPEDIEAKVSLASESTSDTDDETEGQAATDQGKPTPEKPPQRLPRDRYVAPEMANWSRVFRIGHNLLIPTRVNDSNTMLFILDTGAFSNTMSPAAAREVTKVRGDDSFKVKGLSGDVNKTYRADKATLVFGNMRQPNEDIATFDISGISRNLGVEVSGFLGFSTFRIVETKIDYRDGLVTFIYDPNKLPASLRPR